MTLGAGWLSRAGRAVCHTFLERAAELVGIERADVAVPGRQTNGGHIVKQVLFVSYLFPPVIAGGIHRVAQFSKYLPTFDWLPTVLTVSDDPRHPVDDELLRELPAEIEIVRAYCPLLRAGTPNQPHRQGGIAGSLRTLKRQLSRLAFIPEWQVVWYPWAVQAGRRLLRRRKFDAVLATYGPATNLLVGARLAREARLPLVVDFRDVWADNPLPVWPTPFHRRAALRMERRIVRQAAQVIAVSVPMTRHLAELHDLPTEKMTTITNGFDPQDLPRARDRRFDIVPAADEAPRPFRLCFTGSVYGSVFLQALFAAVAELGRNGRITPATFRLQFVGNMTIDEPRQAGVAEYVDVHPPVPHKQVFEYLGQADVLLLVEMIGYHARFSYASKLFDYLLAGKPIVALCEESEMTAHVVRQLGGCVVHPGDVAGISGTIEKLLAARAVRSSPVDIEREPWRSFDRLRLTERLAKVLDAATMQKAPENRPPVAPLVKSAG